MTRLLLSPPIVRFVLFTERWFLSAAFLFVAYEYVATIQLMELIRHSKVVMPAALITRDAGFLDGVHFEDYCRYGLQALCNLFSGVLLLCSRRPSHNPTRAQQVAIPLAATFSYMVFSRYGAFPAWMTTPLVPDSWLSPLAAVGLVFSMAGAGVSAVSILWLGRSMGIVVSVREVVIGGPYRFVRHPIYFGYFIFFVGLMLTACTVRMTILVGGTVLMLTWRARLEEQLLCAHSPAYCEWRKVTGFLWPRWRSLRTEPVIRISPADVVVSEPASSSV